jgi:hypothetical protein
VVKTGWKKLGRQAKRVEGGKLALSNVVLARHLFKKKSMPNETEDGSYDVQDLVVFIAAMLKSTMSWYILLLRDCAGQPCSRHVEPKSISQMTR